jgi:heme-degrading monooxygenase HmoA
MATVGWLKAANPFYFVAMIIVVFTAVLGELDDDYASTSAHLRSAAFEQFGCVDFKSVEQDGEEITYSIWPDAEHVRAWKAYSEHLRAQRLAAQKWCKSYRTITAEIMRDRGWAPE